MGQLVLAFTSPSRSSIVRPSVSGSAISVSLAASFSPCFGLVYRSLVSPVLSFTIPTDIGFADIHRLRMCLSGVINSLLPRIRSSDFLHVHLDAQGDMAFYRSSPKSLPCISWHILDRIDVLRDILDHTIPFLPYLNSAYPLSLHHQSSCRAFYMACHLPLVYHKSPYIKNSNFSELSAEWE